MEFETKILRLASRFDLSVTSWIRSARRNALVGGVVDSRHLVGLAVDVVLDDRGRTDEFMATARVLGLVVIDEGDHIHVQESRV